MGGSGGVIHYLESGDDGDERRTRQKKARCLHNLDVVGGFPLLVEEFPQRQPPC